MSAVLGLDVGGANLKAAHTDGSARSVPFALWKDSAGLPAALGRLVAAMPSADKLAVTMTGELCDCFAAKRDGVRAILDAVEAVAGKRPMQVFATDGRFRDLESARSEPLNVAAANWLALATFAGRFVPRGPAVLIDVGSTTTDIVPLLDGRPVPEGRTDPQRLRAGELVYTGVRRTPLCALLGSEVAAELFATTLDANLVLGHLAEEAADGNTADGRPATVEAAHARLARMLCADLESSTDAERRRLAERAWGAQVELVARNVKRVAKKGTGYFSAGGKVPCPLFCGEGEFLASAALRRLAPDGAPAQLSGILGPDLSRAACAYAVAVLAAEAG
jgi:probable H4MPT-linked C1 transfer pathway protein